MWNLSKSVIVMAVIVTEIIPGLLAISISFYPEKFEEDLSFNFEEPMDKCDNTEHETVNLVNMGLEIVRDNFIVSDTVKSINLEDNKITYISPIAFKSVPNLSCLNIRRNYIKNITNFLTSFNHALLTKLNLASIAYEKTFDDYKIFNSRDSNVKIAALSGSFLPNVTHLDISDNNLSKLPLYLNSSFPRLTHLYLSDNKFDYRFYNHIPETTQYLYLERNRGIINLLYFPNNIYALFLNENNFEWNYMSYQNSNLRILSIRNCYNFNPLFSYVDIKKLMDLDMSSNNIDFIDLKLLKNAESLQRFSLDHNSLDSLLFVAPLRSLTDLSIAHNKLTNITSNFIANLKNLKKLNLRGNRIAIIAEDAFLNLKMLEKLDLAENRLTTLPVSWMHTLKRLRYLNLKSNLFSSIDSMSIYTYSNLNHLFLGNNSFIQFELENLIKLPSNIVVHV